MRVQSEHDAAAHPTCGPAVISAAHVRSALQSAAGWLERHAEAVNALNVFPVPDGDTGTNMSLTLRAAAAAAQTEGTGRVDALLRAVSRGALMGARGNSGVILSQIIRGFADAALGLETLSPADLKRGFRCAAEAGYRAVATPVEGTILTVARRVAESVEAGPDGQESVTQVLDRAHTAARRAVADTVNQLETLRRAGVVDAGGEGLRLFLEALSRVARGEALDVSGPGPVRPLLVGRHDVGEGELGHCTELLIEDCTVPSESVRAYLESVGSSVIVVSDGNLIRVHVHVEEPDAVLRFAAERGRVSGTKIENMQAQHEAAAAGDETVVGGVGVIVVAPGSGFRELFKSLGAAEVVDGGQTMNPSVGDLLDAVARVGHRDLILLPNNGNILMAARQAAEQSPRRIGVIPTESVPAGLSALMALSFEDDLESNVRRMEEAAANVSCLEVTRAARDAEVDGVAVRVGQSLGLLDGVLVSAAGSLCEALMEGLAAARPLPEQIVTLFGGADVTDDELAAAAARVQQQHPDCIVETVRGGQPHYPYLVALE
ncbi:MAG: DAK2 domain-containing protein [Chloroflexota bacterium]